MVCKMEVILNRLEVRMQPIDLINKYAPITRRSLLKAARNLTIYFEIYILHACFTVSSEEMFNQSAVSRYLAIILRIIFLNKNNHLN